MVWVRVGMVKAMVEWLGLVWAWFVSGVGVAWCGYALSKDKFGVRVEVVTNRGALDQHPGLICCQLAALSSLALSRQAASLTKELNFTILALAGPGKPIPARHFLWCWALTGQSP